jgi:hypothetical protein
MGERVFGLDTGNFAKHLEQARQQGRICHVGIDPILQVRAFFDIGRAGSKSDAIAIWLAQLLGREVRLLDYIEGIGQPLSGEALSLIAQSYRVSSKTPYKREIAIGPPPAFISQIADHDKPSADRHSSRTEHQLGAAKTTCHSHTAASLECDAAAAWHSFAPSDRPSPHHWVLGDALWLERRRHISPGAAEYPDKVNHGEDDYSPANKLHSETDAL